MDASGNLRGICSIEGQEAYDVEGKVDLENLTVEFHGTSWINQSGLNYMCTFYGDLSSDYKSMSGTKEAINTSSESERHPGPWKLWAN